jgi:AraC-like DNA-binding protein
VTPLLLNILTNKLLPWAVHNRGRNIIVARPHMSSEQLPEHVHLTPYPIVGKRVIVKNRRVYGNIRDLKANWPEAGLQEWESYRLVCVVEGNFDFRVGSYLLHCPQGISIIVPPGLPLGRGYPDGDASREKRGCLNANFVLHSNAMQGFIGHAQQGEDRATIVENYLFRDSRVVHLFQSLLHEMIDAEDDYENIAADILNSFWRLLIRKIKQGNYITPGPIGRPQQEGRAKNSGDFTTELTAYIQSHLNQPLTLDHMSRAMYLSKAQFVRKMRAETGQTFVQFLNNYRMEEAKVLLVKSDWTISAIATFLGYSTPNYFQKVFFNHFQQTPGHYRKTQRKE